MCGVFSVRQIKHEVPDSNAPLVTVPWFLEDGSRAIVRHPANKRSQKSVKEKYKRGILTHGILEGCRGEAWLVAQGHGQPYLAVTFGTLPYPYLPKHCACPSVRRIQET